MFKSFKWYWLKWTDFYTLHIFGLSPANIERILLSCGSVPPTIFRLQTKSIAVIFVTQPVCVIWILTDFKKITFHFHHA